MRARKLLPVLIAAALAAIFAPSAIAAAATDGLSAYEYDGGVVGMVEANAPGRCAEGREVEVFEQAGARGSAGDALVGRARAEKEDGVYLWSLATRRGDDLYAVAPAEPGCPALAGARAAAAPRGDGPSCAPSSKAGFCVLATRDQQMNFDSASCKAFRLRPGSCSGGDTTGGAWPWSGNITGEFRWDPWVGDAYRLLYFSHRGSDNTGIAHLSGTLPGAGSDRFTVEDGYAQVGEQYGDGPHFLTPDLPGVKPGEQGGPIHFDFSAGCSLFCHDHVYFYGWLLVK
jgi:hypothetical protein